MSCAPASAGNAPARLPATGALALGDRAEEVAGRLWFTDSSVIPPPATARPGNAGTAGCSRAAGSGSPTLALREGSLAGVLAALAAAEAAVRDGEDAPHGSWVQLQISAALALLADWDAEQAAARLGPVFYLPAEMRLATFAARLSAAETLALAAPQRGGSAARGIAEQVAVYLRHSPGDAMPYPLALGQGAVS